MCEEEVLFYDSEHRCSTRQRVHTSMTSAATSPANFPIPLRPFTVRFLPIVSSPFRLRRSLAIFR